ncbi:MAG: type II toxin-antitoxin system VapC family toxin [Patescibacteria group bacterium]
MTIDSNIIIAYLAGDKDVIKVLSQWQKDGKPLFVSTIAEAEVLSFRGSTTVERHIMKKLIEENFVSVPFDKTLASIAANLRRNFEGIKLPDAAIAATALFTGTPLVTRNERDFRKIHGLLIISI